ncbi:MAG: hypothetical protein JSV93_02000 [Candidatus Omnitrophota bacterium]|nr:MAG: hypothetical protein JSV93_02000 [Candidatus Omnitrophota bacterium]
MCTILRGNYEVTGDYNIVALEMGLAINSGVPLSVNNPEFVKYIVLF